VIVVLALVVILLGCGSSPEGSAERTTTSRMQVMRVERAEVEQIDVAVTAQAYRDEAAECEDPRSRSPITLLALRWEEDGLLRRRISADFDSDGNPVRYSDARGAMTNIRNMGGQSPGTLIHLEYLPPHATVQNQDAEGHRTQSVEFDAALSAAKLDVPNRWINVLWERCRAEDE
jgi:hypothetical protein